MSHVPENRHAAIQRALDATFPGLKPEVLSQLTGGGSGAGIYQFEAAGQRWILRCEGPSHGLNDPERQYACLETAAEAGVSPAALFTCPEDGVAIMPFVAGRPAQEIALKDRLTMIGRALATLHASPCFPVLLPYIDLLDKILDAMSQTGVLPAEALAEHERLYAMIAAAYRRLSETSVSSHNDLNPANILYSGDRAWFIDWEMAFAADRYVDLAAVANYHCLDEEQETLLLETYFGQSPSNYQKARLWLMRVLNRYFYGALLLLAANQASPDTRLTAAEMDTPPIAEIRHEMATILTTEGRFRFGCAFLQDARRALVTPRYQEALAACAL
ncbi:MAG TPA: phosphotransferase [Oscillatoriaceae cyanobacterium]